MITSQSSNTLALAAFTCLGFAGNLFAQDVTYNSVTLPNAGPLQRLHISNTETAGTFPIRISPAEPVAKKFNFCIFGNSNAPYDTRLNQVFRFGWNLGPGGQRVDTNDGALGMEFESHYAPNATDRYFEQHTCYVNALNRVYRPLSWTITKSNDYIFGFITADKFSWHKPSNMAQWMIFEPYQISLKAGTVVLADTNNTPLFKQMNAAGNSYIPLFQLNNLDQVVIGPWGNNANFGGKVGVGITPAQKLHVNGVARLEPLASAPTGGKGDLYAKTDGTLWFHNGSLWKQVTLQ